MSAVPQLSQDPSQARKPVAVFDYDGTCVDGQSGSLISLWLKRKGYLSMRVTIGLAWWGIRYKFHLPFRQERSRELIFWALRDRTPQQIEQIMADFHQEVLVPRYRKRAIEEIALRKQEGCATVVVSATFEDIAREAARYLGADGFVATQMERDEKGNYTGRVLGDVIAGDAKVDAARAWANEALGEGAWNLAYAYGDHHSDIKLLSAAEHPTAVCPGPTLKRYAKEQGWPRANWKDE